MRQPTDAEYLAYDGMHCRNAQPARALALSVLSTEQAQILQWGERKGSNARIYGPIGWKAGLHRHHDHQPCDGMDFGGSAGRFPATVICGACNYADARAK